MLILLSIHRVLATTVWNETFENLNDWELFSATGVFNEGVWNYQLINPEFSLVNGALNTPYTPTWGYVSLAIRNSTVTTGTWSFDVYLPPGEENKCSFTVIIMFNDPDGNYNLTGSIGEYWSTKTGYGVNFDNTNETGSEILEDWSSLSFISFWGGTGTFGNLVYPKSNPISSASLVGPYHIDMTRDETGQFCVYYDRNYTKPFIQTKDIYSSISSKFALFSRRSAAQIENITVSDSIDIIYSTTTTTTTAPVPVGIESYFVILPVVITTLVTIHKKRRR